MAASARASRKQRKAVPAINKSFYGPGALRPVQPKKEANTVNDRCSQCRHCRCSMDCACDFDQALRRVVQQGHTSAQFLTGQANRLAESASRADRVCQMEGFDAVLERALSQALWVELNLLHTIL